MADTFVISGLTERASRIMGEIAALEQQIVRYKHDLAHIQAAAKLFDPDYDISGVRRKSPKAPRSPLFGQGEITRSCREALRDAAEPVTLADIVSKIMASKGLDASNE